MDFLQNIDQFDKLLFLEINEWNSPFFDPIMKFFTSTWAWLPLYFYFIYLLIVHFKWNVMAIFVSLALLITATDKFSSAYMKPTFKRLRPCYEPTIKQKVHTPYGCGGDYGFISSHASNTFGVAMFLFLLLRASVSYMGLIFIWPVWVSYTRIYLGVHYPLDVLSGGICGVVFASVLYTFVQNSFLAKYFQKQSS